MLEYADAQTGFDITMHGVDVPYDPVMKRLGEINQLGVERKIDSVEATHYNE